MVSWITRTTITTHKDTNHIVIRVIVSKLILVEMNGKLRGIATALVVFCLSKIRRRRGKERVRGWQWGRQGSCLSSSAHALAVVAL